MKTFIVSSLLSLLYISSMAQSFKMVDPSNEWVYSTTNFFNGNISSESFQFSEDSTMIGDKYYHELFSYGQENQQGTKSSQGYYRQTNDSIFYSMPGASEGILFYVFNLEIGDTVTLYDSDPLVVDTIMTSNLLNGQEIEEYYLACPAFGEINMIYFEGFGSPVQIENTWPCIIFDTGESLLCFKRNNEVLYQRGNVGECWLTDTYDINTLSFLVKPNPVTDIIHLSNCENCEHIMIYNSGGQLVLDQTYQSTIDVKLWKSGMYILKIVDSKGAIGSKKIMIK